MCSGALFRQRPTNAVLDSPLDLVPSRARNCRVLGVPLTVDRERAVQFASAVFFYLPSCHSFSSFSFLLFFPSFFILSSEDRIRRSQCICIITVVFQAWLRNSQMSAANGPNISPNRPRNFPKDFPWQRSRRRTKLERLVDPILCVYAGRRFRHRVIYQLTLRRHGHRLADL